METCNKFLLLHVGYSVQVQGKPETVKNKDSLEILYVSTID